MRWLRMMIVWTGSAVCVAAASAHAAGDRPVFVPRIARTAVVTDSTAETAKLAAGNQVGMALTNYGYFGNNFINRNSSLEYPLGSGIEHLARSGIWIGANAVDGAGAFTGVSSALHDGSHGFYPGPASEFSPAGTQISERSTDPGSPFYSAVAVSPHDYVTVFSDRPGGFTTLTNEDHRPLNLLVKQEVYSWPWPTLDDILFVRFRIVNLGNSALTGVRVGFYTEFASGNKNAYSCWPPSSSCGTSGYGGWYGKAWLQYDPALRLMREHYCGGVPVPGGCQLQRAPQWMGIQLLTPPGPSQAVTLAAWRWEPFALENDTDVERYAIMGAGTIANLADPDLMPLTGDPVEMLCIGPFASIASGDSITVDYAFVGGAEIADIQNNAAKAQQLRDANFDTITPVTVSLMSASADPGRVWVSWLVSGGARAEVERTRDGAIWTRRADVSADGSGVLAYEDREVVPGCRYGYRLRIAGETAGETWVDVPQPAGFGIRSLTPNPSRGEPISLSLSLPGAAPAWVEMFDLTGRMVSHGVWNPGPGVHRVRLPDSERLSPGVYLVRLTHGSLQAESRVAVTR